MWQVVGSNYQDYPQQSRVPPTELHVEWDETLPQYTLRWQVRTFAYQLRSTGIASPQKDELITLAQTIR